MLRITSINVNGIRSAAKKDLIPWLAQHQADIVCLQEIKVSHEDLATELRHPLDYQGEFFHAQKKGYSGVGIYTKTPAIKTVHGMSNEEFDAEGRIIRMDWENLSVISAYLPSGSSGEDRQAAKFRFLASFDNYLDAIMKDYLSTGRNYLICGDWNIAHKEIDLKNWKGNLKNSGFTPEERAWIDDVFVNRGFVDVFRKLNPNPDEYTWWSNRGQAWAKNVGWRIDYHVATPALAEKAQATSIYKDQRFSDHAPLTIDYDWSLSL